MNTIDKIYRPYEFSANPCYAILLSVTSSGYMKIEKKLPNYIKKITGVYISVGCWDFSEVKRKPSKLAGNISLNFNGQAFKTLFIPVQRTKNLTDCSWPIPLKEDITPNSFMQGYYYDLTNVIQGFPYSLTIYLHYERQTL